MAITKTELLYFTKKYKNMDSLRRVISQFYWTSAELLRMQRKIEKQAEPIARHKKGGIKK